MEKIVDFNAYCPKCEHDKEDSCAYPCSECLGQPVNENSRKPVFFKKVKKGRTDKK